MAGRSIKTFITDVGMRTQRAVVEVDMVDSPHPLDVSILDDLYLKVSEVSACVRMMAGGFAMMAGDWPYAAMWDDWKDRTHAALTLFAVACWSVLI